MHFHIVQRASGTLTFQLALADGSVALIGAPQRDVDACVQAIREVVTSLREGTGATRQAKGGQHRHAFVGEDGDPLADTVARPGAAEALALLAELQRDAAAATQVRITFPPEQRVAHAASAEIAVAVRYDLDEPSRSDRRGLELLRRTGDRLHTAHFNDADGKALLYLRGFSSRHARDEQARALIQGLSDVRRFRRQNGDDRVCFVVTARNGRELARSRWFAAWSDCERAITWLVGIASEAAADLEDLDGGAGTPAARKSAAPSVYLLDRPATTREPGFELFRADDGRHYFHLVGPDAAALLFSHGYSAPRERDAGMRAVIRGAMVREHYQRRRDGDQWFFAVLAGNSRELARSRNFTDEPELDRAITWTIEQIAALGNQVGVRRRGTMLVPLSEALPADVAAPVAPASTATRDKTPDVSPRPAAKKGPALNPKKVEAFLASLRTDQPAQSDRTHEDPAPAANDPAPPPAPAPVEPTATGPALETPVEPALETPSIDVDVDTPPILPVHGAATPVTNDEILPPPERQHPAPPQPTDELASPPDQPPPANELASPTPTLAPEQPAAPADELASPTPTLAPEQPAAPVAASPTSSTEPTSPTSSTEPTSPTSPTEPTSPTSSTEPASPTEPVKREPSVRTPTSAARRTSGPLRRELSPIATTDPSRAEDDAAFLDQAFSDILTEADPPPSGPLAAAPPTTDPAPTPSQQSATPASPSQQSATPASPEPASTPASQQSATPTPPPQQSPTALTAPKPSTPAPAQQSATSTAAPQQSATPTAPPQQSPTALSASKPLAPATAQQSPTSTAAPHQSPASPRHPTSPTSSVPTQRDLPPTQPTPRASQPSLDRPPAASFAAPAPRPLLAPPRLGNAPAPDEPRKTGLVLPPPPKLQQPPTDLRPLLASTTPTPTKPPQPPTDLLPPLSTPTKPPQPPTDLLPPLSTATKPPQPPTDLLPPLSTAPPPTKLPPPPTDLLPPLASPAPTAPPTPSPVVAAAASQPFDVRHLPPAQGPTPNRPLARRRPSVAEVLSASRIDELIEEAPLPPPTTPTREVSRPLTAATKEPSRPLPSATKEPSSTHATARARETSSAHPTVRTSETSSAHTAALSGEISSTNDPSRPFSATRNKTTPTAVVPSAAQSPSLITPAPPGPRPRAHSGPRSTARLPSLLPETLPEPQATVPFPPELPEPSPAPSNTPQILLYSLIGVLLVALAVWRLTQ